MACTSGSKGTVDAKIQLADVAVPIDAATCTATASYGTVMFDVQQEIDYAANTFGSGSPHEEDVNAALDADALPDLFHLWLYDGLGGFGSGPVRIGTYTLAGDDLSYEHCGICVFIGTNTGSNGVPLDTYMATGGTVTITSASGTLAGSVANLTFAHVDIGLGSDGTQTIDADGCTSMIGSAAFSGTLQVGTASFVGKSETSLPHRFR